MGVDQGNTWTTTILIKNMHCASCVSYIQRILSGFGGAIHHVETNIVSHEVGVHHVMSLSAAELCRSLSDSAFEVYNATTLDDAGCKVCEFGGDEGGDGWLELASDLWRPSLRKPMSLENMQHPGRNRRNVHLANCDACRKESDCLPEKSPVANIAVHQAAERASERSHSGTATREHGVGAPRSSESLSHCPSSDIEAQYEAILSIGGMTCASCTSAIDHGLTEMPFVENVSVTLMTNSGRVVFKGKHHLQSIIDKVEDLGYDTALERCVLLDSNGEGIKEKSRQRSIMLKVDGMFCRHCPSRIIEAIESKYKDDVVIVKPLTLKDPVLEIIYMPRPPKLTIRDIIAAIDALNDLFITNVYLPPSIEQRSQSMQKNEQNRLLARLVFSFVIAIPTLLIGVIWMSLVPASNNIRRFFEQSTWSTSITRADWALFILATPVFFLAADVFHIRAFKEIRALWRKGSTVPLLQKFYRFGSMNLLISAGTSIAYFASIAILGIEATTRSRSLGQGSTYFDSVVFLTFFILTGRYLEAYTKAKTGNAVGMLGNLRPREAIILNPPKALLGPETYPKNSENYKAGRGPPSHSNTERVDVNLLEVGDVVMVPHGSSPPADGIIVEGSTNFNESSLTGEARAIAKRQGDTVFVGAINIGDPISFRTTGVGGTSMLDQIVAVVREGQTKHAPIERVVDVVTGYFVPLITALAILTFIVWLALGQSGVLSRGYLGSRQGGWAFWSLEFAIAVFVVACPCGIGLAAPTALFVGSGLAASHGILVRGGGEAFQEASNIDAVVFDKTGTLTEGGRLTVTDHEMLAEDEDAGFAWSITQSLEQTSSHPLARALFECASAQPRHQIQSLSITEKPGMGLLGSFTIESASGGSITYEAVLGSESLVTSLGSSPSLLNYFTGTTLARWKSESKSVALLAMRKIRSPTSSSPWALAAIFAISDPIRASALHTISALQSRGIPVYMLTGDNPITASAVASTLSIPQDHVFAGVLPTDKSSKICWLQENAPRRSGSSSWLKKLTTGKTPKENKKSKAIIAFIGDGINDAPALTTADVSISLSSASDIAMHSSSFILLSSSLDSVITLLDLSAQVFRRVKYNFGWAVVYNVILVPVAAGVFFKVKEGGWRLGPVWASAAMALSSLSVICSSLALRWEGGWGFNRMSRARLESEP